MTRTLLPKLRPNSGERIGTMRTSTRISRSSWRGNWEWPDFMPHADAIHTTQYTIYNTQYTQCNWIQSIRLISRISRFVLLRKHLAAISDTPALIFLLFHVSFGLYLIYRWSFASSREQRLFFDVSCSLERSGVWKNIFELVSKQIKSQKTHYDTHNGGKDAISQHNFIEQVLVQRYQTRSFDHFIGIGLQAQRHEDDLKARDDNKYEEEGEFADVEGWDAVVDPGAVVVVPVDANVADETVEFVGKNGVSTFGADG